MFILRLRFWLPVVSTAVLVGSLAVLAWSVFVPCQVDVSSAVHVRRSRAEPAPTGEPSRVSLESFEPLLRRRFQTPLYDPPPKKPPPVVKQVTPPPPVKLLATMPEAGGGHAMFSDPKGAILIKAMGDQITGGNSPTELVEIAADHVVLRQEEQLITLKLSKE